jgi:hypothetical protein
MLVLDITPDEGAMRSQYRATLGRLAQERERALAEAETARRNIAALLPEALEAGVSVIDAAGLTGVSRPTIYRLLAGARERHDLTKEIARLEHALATLDERALPFELAGQLETSVDEVFASLMRVYPSLSSELATLGPIAFARLVELVPDLGIPERLILPMLLFQGLSTDRVAWSTKLSEAEVLGWASLGLLRLLPRLRELTRLPSGLDDDDSETAEEPVLTPAHHTWRYPIGDPRRFQ